MTQKKHEPRDMAEMIVELARKKQSSIPASVVRSIIQSEIDHLEDRVRARQEIEAAVEGILIADSTD